MGEWGAMAKHEMAAESVGFSNAFNKSLLDRYKDEISTRSMPVQRMNRMNTIEEAAIRRYLEQGHLISIYNMQIK